MLFFLLSLLSQSIELKTVSSDRLLTFTQYGFVAGGKYSLFIYTKSNTNFSLLMLSREGFNAAKTKALDFCDNKTQSGTISVSNISDDLAVYNWTGEISKTGIYQPVIMVCQQEVPQYSVTYKADNPIIHLDYRYLQASLISKIFAFIFIILSVIGVLNWCFHPQFLIAIHLINTATSISASIMYALLYVYYNSLPEFNQLSRKHRFITSFFVSLTITLTLITGYMAVTGFSIISTYIHTLPFILQIGSAIFLGVCIFILDYGTEMIVSIFVGLFAVTVLIFILYAFLSNLANLFSLRNETSDETTRLKIKLAIKSTLIWLSALLVCLISAPQEIGHNMLFGLSLALMIQNGGLCLCFTFSGGYRTEKELEHDNEIVYIEDPNSKCLSMMQSVESA